MPCSDLEKSEKQEDENVEKLNEPFVFAFIVHNGGKVWMLWTDSIFKEVEFVKLNWIMVTKG